MIIDIEYIKNIMTNVYYSPNRKCLYDMGNAGISLQVGRYCDGEFNTKLTITMKKNIDIAIAFIKFFYDTSSILGQSFYFNISGKLRRFEFVKIEHFEFKMSQNPQCTECLSIESYKAEVLQNQNFDNEQMLDGEIILYGFLEQATSLPNKPIDDCYKS